MCEIETINKWQKLLERARKLDLVLFFNEVDCDYLIITDGGPAKRLTILDEVDVWLEAVEWARENM